MPPPKPMLFTVDLIQYPDCVTMNQGFSTLSTVHACGDRESFADGGRAVLCIVGYSAVSLVSLLAAMASHKL